MLCEAGRVAILTGKLPSHLKDQLDDLEEFIDNKISRAGAPWNDPKELFFVRLDECSPKDSGLKPMRKAKDILSSILSSKRCMLRVEYTAKTRSTPLQIILKKVASRYRFW